VSNTLFDAVAKQSVVALLVVPALIAVVVVIAIVVTVAIAIVAMIIVVAMVPVGDGISTFVADFLFIARQRARPADALQAPFRTIAELSIVAIGVDGTRAPDVPSTGAYIIAGVMLEVCVGRLARQRERLRIRGIARRDVTDRRDLRSIITGGCSRGEWKGRDERNDRQGKAETQTKTSRGPNEPAIDDSRQHLLTPRK
jgi:hypothetical protein